MSAPAKPPPEPLRLPVRLATLLLGAVLLASCGRDEPAYRQSFPALGTLISVEIHGADHERATEATAAVAAYLAHIGREWYAWGDGELAEINAALARSDPAPVPAELEALIRRALAIRERSDGYFDPTVGLLVEKWGFDSAENPPTAPPDEAWLAEWRAGAANRAGLTIVDGVVAAPGPLKLALGGIAKGTALEVSIQMLRDRGIANALVEAGGDLKVIGAKAGRKWRIGIRDPHSDGILGVVALDSGEAIVSSGDYERYFEQDGGRTHHLLDPHTGRPVLHTAGVTVLHGDAEFADAVATALMAAGPERFDALTARMGIRLAMLVTTGGDIMTTAAMRARLDADQP